MFKCTLCGSSSHCRGKRILKPDLYEWTHQCQNVHCGHCFVTLESFKFFKEKEKPEDTPQL
ncbi:ogr/Delta-like zinc finger family protein [Providencia rettgeri]|uniref:ogr/Delta-like zinc finger family protein n=1 Tax=Providencia rettgeri TaxID=587 RepID=UPI003019637D